MTTDATPKFRALLQPHRSLSGPGFIVLMSAVGIVSFGAGIAFLMLGAWPVFGFFGLDAVLIYWAFKRNYADAKIFETVEIIDGEVVVRKGGAKLETQEWRLQAYWARVELDYNENLETYGPLWLTSHGKKLRLGAFLSPGELKNFADAFDLALKRAKTTP
ncbi:MAG: DUF2244 domain-containing protein [Hyphomicrobiales bacterium]